MVILVKHIFFKNFLNRNNKNDDVSKYMPPFCHFEFFFYETKDNMLVIIHAKLKSIAVVVGILGRG